MNHPETVVAVMHIGEPHQEVAGGVLAKKTTRMTLRTTDHPLVAEAFYRHSHKAQYPEKPRDERFCYPGPAALNPSKPSPEADAYQQAEKGCSALMYDVNFRHHRPRSSSPGDV
jgi:hypothetical protein